MERQGVTEHESTKGRVITVTLNPAVDLFVSVKHLEPGTLHRVPTPSNTPGAKGSTSQKCWLV
ncbi:hypothetical protein [Alicyclobacillus fastidiosus]|uniref:hypothetical protein n=1 Tax=Alicyclobacillus fastidiosus TaxID=392011 RepID=UPI0023E98A1D|nr:hypothetical protein [Alicyclobacillus fastidiosus]GMA62446.1 hypothetical protein GCM10025859_28860 [Alicyclobacillus fastidiosus]